jgi:uncharacterized Zn-finger protein
LCCANAYHPGRKRVNASARSFSRRAGLIAVAAIPSTQKPTMQPFETILVDTMIAACNGGGGPLGHPRVYLNLSAEGQVVCPYCSRLYVNEAKRAGRLVQGHGVETPGATHPGAETDHDHPTPRAPDPASPGVPPASPRTRGATSSSANPAKP